MFQVSSSHMCLVTPKADNAEQSMSIISENSIGIPLI